MSLMYVDIQNLKGIGSKRADLFRKLNINTIGELIRNYPRTYEDFSSPTLISDTRENNFYCIKATISSKIFENKIRPGLTIYKVKAYDQSGSITISFFNTKYIAGQLLEGNTYIFRGMVKNFKFHKEMNSPNFCDPSKSSAIKPIYSQTAGLTTKQIEASVRSAFTLLPKEIRDPIPESIREKCRMCDLSFAIHNIHFPKDSISLQKAKRRLIFEELLMLHLGLLLCKQSNKLSHPVCINESHVDEFQSLLPFELTGAQKRTIDESISDMLNQKYAMSRLVQGDVGSGKTAVCAALCHTIVKEGYQCAVMAPTEILAVQHFNWFKKVFKPLGFSIELLTGSTPKSKRRTLLPQLETGVTDICIGTHALISENISFAKLGLVVTDEQHRFGVEQRAKLISKGTNPHMLVMSATPIPRTLALIIHGDLDVSLLDELPPGRQEVKTYHIKSEKRADAFGFIKKIIDEGRQCYIVCPTVDESGSNLIDVTTYADKNLKSYFDGYTFDILHGKMSPYEKSCVMDKFAQGETQILISTTVIEVGVDVPNATVILVENAERFGLSQLHQLRGRVGRGDTKSYCILVSDAKSDDATKRMNIMCKTNDGFKIADEDLKIRGPGDFFGDRQHGLPTLKVANLLTDMSTLAEVSNIAQEILQVDPDLSSEKNKTLLAEVNRLFISNKSYMQ